jgi:hypothetical protein
MIDESTNDSFKERRKELTQFLNQIEENDKIIISAKPKKNNHNLSIEGFRGSIYRGVSKNKNKW